MPAIAVSPIPSAPAVRRRSPSVGSIGGASSSTAPNHRRRQSPPTLSNASPNAIGSKPRSAKPCAEERRHARQRRAKPLVEALKTWLEKTLDQLAGGSTLAQAIRYGLSRWEGLTRFIDAGRIEIDSNTVERSMRPVALNRKNALFAGSDHGAANWAMLASLIETCKRHSVNPQAYLTDVLTKLVNNCPNRRLAELTPWAWTAANP